MATSVLKWKAHSLNLSSSYLQKYFTVKLYLHEKKFLSLDQIQVKFHSQGKIKNHRYPGNVP